jgi:hypothetical protein
MKLWIAGHASKAQRTTDWFVPTDLESDAAKLHYGMRSQSVAFVKGRHPKPRHADAKDSSLRRSA